MRRTKTIFLIVVLVTSFFTLFAQDLDLVGNKKMTKAQAEEEYRLIYESLINYHPYPFMYTSKEELQQYFDEALSNLQSQTTYRDVHLFARTIIAKVKCGHSFAKPSKEWYKSTYDIDFLLPFSIEVLDNRVVIQNTIDAEFEFDIGDELISINSISLSQILDDMYAIQERDGHTLSLVESKVSNLFRYYYLFLYGVEEQVNVKFKNEFGEELSTQVSFSSKDLKKLKPEQDTIFETVYKNKWSRFGLHDNGDIAYLKVNSFGDRKEFKKYYKKVFSTVNERKVEHLILDLRNNGGGFFGNGNKILSYLDEERFEFNFHRPKKELKKNKYTKLDIWSKLTRFAFLMKPGKNKVEGRKTYTFKTKPQNNRFEGELYVLINGITFSQAALVASQLHKTGVTFYGSETGGTESGANAIIRYLLTLPYSGTEIRIPYYRIESNSIHDNFGFGVKPSEEAKISNMEHEAVIDVIEQLLGRE